MPRLLLIVLLLACFPAPSAPAGDILVEKTYDPTKTRSEIRITALVSEIAPSGYMAVRVYLNNGTKIGRTWRLNFLSTDSSWTDSGNEMRSNFSLFCGPGQSQSYEVLVPLVTSFMEDFSSTTELKVTAIAPGFGAVSDVMSTEYNADWPAVMMSEDLETRNGSMLDAEVAGLLSSHGGSSDVPFAGSFNPREMSSDWRAYAGYDYCLLTEKDWRDLSPGARNALLRWNRLGGGLLVYSGSGIDLASLGIPNMEQGPRSAQRSWGIVKIGTLPSNNQLNAKETVRLIDREIPATKGQNRLLTLREDFSSSWPLQDVFGSKTAHVLFFILVLIAFGILVGPINLFVFAKAGQRHRLFITTPLISLGASLLLIVLILFQDGFGGRGQRLILMEVRPDDGENAAYLSQEQISRTGVLLSTGFKTSEPAYLSPVLLGESRWARVTDANNGGSSRFTASVEEDGLDVTGDWFKSRSEHGHYLETIRPTRGRIELKGDPGAPVITSTFEFPLAEVIYTDGQGAHWRAENVAQGRSATLAPMNKDEFRKWKTLESNKFSKRNRSRVAMTAGRRDHFVATSRETPGIDTLDSVSWNANHALITGPVLRP